jgi:hypothetical protein
MSVEHELVERKQRKEQNKKNNKLQDRRGGRVWSVPILAKSASFFRIILPR